MKVLGVLRLSRETEESTSIERQREIVTTWASAGGHELAGLAIDSDVSAGVAPEDRPGLGPWLRGERGDFAALAAWRVDRIARSARHFAELRERWRIIGISDGIDTDTPAGKLVGQMMATVAEGERDAIKARTRDSFAKLTATGRHRGGFVPLGYRAVRGDAGWRLVIDPEGQALVREIVGWVVGGLSVNAAVARLNARGEPTSLDRQRIAAGKPSSGARWRLANLLRLLRSETLLGYLVLADGTVPLDDHGRRVRRAEPLLSAEEWSDLQAELSRRGNDQRARPRANAALLVGVAYCQCGERMYTTTGGRGREPRYRCASKGIGGVHCGNGSVPAAWLDDHVSAWFIELFGRVELVERRRVAGEDHSAELAETVAAMGRLVRQLERLDGAAADAVAARLGELQAQHDELAARPIVADRWVDVPTGQTYGDLWEAADVQGRRRLLLGQGVRAEVSKAPGRGQVAAVELDWATGTDLAADELAAIAEAEQR